MITVIARWEESQMPSAVEYQLWRQLVGAFKIDRLIFTPIMPDMETYHLAQVAEMGDALDSAEGQRVFLEPTGTRGMADIPDGDIVLITGSTNTSNMPYALPGEAYKINSAARTHLYPTEAAAIALAIRYGQ